MTKAKKGWGRGSSLPNRCQTLSPKPQYCPNQTNKKEICSNDILFLTLKVIFNTSALIQ
jgi:hypothetical protein